MKAKIRTRNGLEEVEIIGKPLQINDIWFFVYRKKYSNYRITEWRTGFCFARVKTRAKICPAINNIFKKVSPEIINHEIQEKIEKYGIANGGIPENG